LLLLQIYLGHSILEVNQPPQEFRPPSNILLAVAQLEDKHNISDDCLQDILTLMKFKGVREKLPATCNSLTEKLGVKKFKVTYGWKCPQCREENNVYRKLSQQLKCSKCNSPPKVNGDHFLALNVEQLLQFNLPIIESYVKRDYEEMSHILTSNGMKSLIANGYDVSNDFSLLVNTDGVPLFKSSATSFWPVLARLNEVTSKESNHNVLLLGVSVGRSKETIMYLLQNIVNQCSKLSTSGVNWKDNANILQVSKIFISGVICDSIAKPMIQKIKQFNGTYGCSYCLHPSNDHYFYYERNRSPMRDRHSHELHCQHLKELMSTDHTRSKKAQQTSLLDCFGVTGFGVFSQLNYFDPIFGFPIDIMHSVYLGVVKQLSESWINVQHLFGNTELNNINQYLLCIKPPYRISRTPRPTSDFKMYKAHEWHMWLLYYSPLILKDNMPFSYFQHWILLVEAISLLTSQCVTTEHINICADLIDRFSKDVNMLYGEKGCTFNIHLLLHLPYFVQQYGPLQHTSMAVFEAANHILKKSVTGSQNAGSQMVKRYCRRVIVSRSKCLEKSVEGFTASHINQGTVVTNDWTLYSPITFLTFDDIDNLILNTISNNLSELTFYRYACYKNKISYKSKFTKAVKRNSYTVLLSNNNVFSIDYFVFEMIQKKMYCFGEMHEVSDLDNPCLRRLNYIVQSKHNYKAIVPIEQIVQIILRIDYNEKAYFCKFVNNVECFAE